MARPARLAAAGLVLAALACLALACGGGGGDPAVTPAGLQTLTVTTSVFTDGGDIPLPYSCDGEKISPDLAWSGAPEATRSFAVLALDPDASDFVHWLVYGIPATSKGLPMGVTDEPQLADGSRQGQNSFGKTGYGPPCPPRGSTHTYRFYVYALDIELPIGPSAGETAVQQAMTGHIRAWGLLSGRFAR